MLKFSDKLMDHFQNPRNVGVIEHPEGTGTVTNPVCGDLTEIYLRIEKGVVEDAKFKSLGCAVTIASASVLTEKVKGREISELLAGSDEDAVRRLVGLIECEFGDLPSAKLHCPPATVQAFLDACSQYLDQEGETGLSARIKKLIPLVSQYYKRGREKDENSLT
jgi:nitrogen fixation NifU-like protein